MNRKVVLVSALLCATVWMRAQDIATSAPQSTAQNTAATVAAGAAATEAQRPLPPVKELLEQVEDNEKKNEALDDQYLYHIHAVTDKFGRNGKVKESAVTDSESLAVDGVRINRLLAKNGKPLDPEEKKKEDERIDKEVAKARKRRQKLLREGKETTGNGEVMMPASRFLELGTFSHPQRVMLEGRPTIVFDFTGDPQAKTKTEFEGIVRDLAGKIYIDEADRQLALVEGHVLKDFKVGLGLVANIHGGLSFRASWEKVNDEVWLPKEIDGKGSARILLFVKMNGQMKVRMSDYQKFRTGATILPGYQRVGPDGKILPEKP